MGATLQVNWRLRAAWTPGPWAAWAGFPSLRRLQFRNSSVLLCPELAGRGRAPRLKRLQLTASYPAPGPMLGPAMVFVTSPLQRGRPGVLELVYSVIRGAARRDSRNFSPPCRLQGLELNRLVTASCGTLALCTARQSSPAVPRDFAVWVMLCAHAKSAMEPQQVRSACIACLHERSGRLVAKCGCLLLFCA